MGLFAAPHESERGTKRTCRGRLTMSAPEGKTDVPREPKHFRFDPSATSGLINIPRPIMFYFSLAAPFQRARL